MKDKNANNYLQGSDMGFKEFHKLMFGTECSLTQLLIIKHIEDIKLKITPRRTGVKQYNEIIEGLIK